MRFRVLDLYRFFAAVLVMAYHYLASFNAHFHGASPYVDFFFMLSGFVIMRGYANRMSTREAFSNFLYARFARLYPLYFATTTVWVVLAALASVGAFHPEHAIQFSASEVIQQYLLSHAWGTTQALNLNGPSWSISAEWAVYLLFPLFIMLRRRFGDTALLALAITAIFGLEMVNHVWFPKTRSWLEWTYDFGAVRAVPNFLIGMWLSTVTGWGVRLKALGVKAGLLLFALSVPLNLIEAPTVVVLLDLAATLYFTACGELRQEGAWLADPRLVCFGDASYAIYMLHTLTLSIFATALRPLLHEAWPTMPVIMILTIAVGLLSYAAFERPAQTWLRKLRAAPSAKIHFAKLA